MPPPKVDSTCLLGMPGLSSRHRCRFQIRFICFILFILTIISMIYNFIYIPLESVVCYYGNVLFSSTIHISFLLSAIAPSSFVSFFVFLIRLLFRSFSYFSILFSFYSCYYTSVALLFFNFLYAP